MDFRAKMTCRPSIKWLFYGLFLLGSIHIHAQKKIDNLQNAVQIERQLQSQPADTSKINSLLKLAEFYRTFEPKTQANTNKAIQYINNAVRISQKLGFKKGIGQGYLIYSNIEQDRHDYKKTIHFAKKAADYFKVAKQYNLLGEAQVMQWSGATLLDNPIEERASLLKVAFGSFGKANNKYRQGDCMKELGDLYQFNRKYSDALPVLKTALACYTAAGKKELFGVYDLLGAVYSGLGDYKEGLAYGLLAVRNAEKLGEKGQMLCTILNRIGFTYYAVHDYSKAINYFEKALDIAMQQNDIASINLIYAEKCTVLGVWGKQQQSKIFLNGILKKYPELIKMDAITPAYFNLNISHSLGQKKQAAIYFNELEQLLKHNPEIAINRTNVYEIMISYLIDIKDFKKAAHYNNVYAEIMDRYNARRSDNISYFQFKIDSVAGNYLSAIKNFQQLKKADDEVLNEETQRQISQLNILYETEKKDRNISQLTKTTEAQQQNLQHEQKLRNIIFIVLGLVVVILFLSVLGYYQKKKTNKLLQKKQQVINDANQSLEHLVTEKEWLLREIHHRVKNNLHMVAGLLASQTEFIKGKEALQAITDSQHRVQAMSIIHQKLYQTETLSHINMATYINELTEYLDGSFSGKCPVKFRLDVDSVDFALSHSIPIGLIINEAVTNAIKYAFDVCGDCQISIRLKKTADDYLLQIKDNGIGMPENFDISQTNSLGMRLIEGLSNDIHADLKIYNDNGSVIELRFHLPENTIEKVAS